MRKRIFAAVIAALLAALLTACVPQTDIHQDAPTQVVISSESTSQTEQVSQETTVVPTQVTVPSESVSQAEEIPPETTAAATQPSLAVEQTLPEKTAAPVFQNDPVRGAFQRTLQTIHDELYWPELPYEEKIELCEPGTIEDEEFAVFDVDGDGQEEPLVSVSNTYTAGMYEIIYGYDTQTDGVRVEAQNYWAVTHYPGMLKVDAAHNHGYAGDILWPYTLQFYQKEKDTYEDVFYVDAWCKAITDYDPYAEMPYPEDADTEQDGYVYLITDNGQKRILNRADYQKWEAELFAGKEPLTIPWQKMTAVNIHSLNTN